MTNVIYETSQGAAVSRKGTAHLSADSPAHQASHSVPAGATTISRPFLVSQPTDRPVVIQSKNARVLEQIIFPDSVCFTMSRHTI